MQCKPQRAFKRATAKQCSNLTPGTRFLVPLPAPLGPAFQLRFWHAALRPRCPPPFRRCAPPPLPSPLSTLRSAPASLSLGWLLYYVGCMTGGRTISKETDSTVNSCALRSSTLLETPRNRFTASRFIDMDYPGMPPLDVFHLLVLVGCRPRRCLRDGPACRGFTYDPVPPGTSSCNWGGFRVQGLCW